MIKEINFSKKAVERINQLIAKKPSGTFLELLLKVAVVQASNMISRLTTKSTITILNIKI